MKAVQRGLLPALAAVSIAAVGIAQAPPAGRGAPAPRLSFWVTSTAWPDGGEVPMKYSGRGDNKSPAFEFHWNLGTNPTNPPDNLKTYAVILHDTENSTNKTTVDTLHWTVFNIPGSAKGLPEGLASGDLPDGTRNGPGIAAGRGGTPGYFGPGAGPGPFHHYLFELYALDTTLDLPANTTRDALMKAMDGHIIAKTSYYGRFHASAQ